MRIASLSQSAASSDDHTLISPSQQGTGPSTCPQEKGEFKKWGYGGPACEARGSEDAQGEPTCGGPGQRGHAEYTARCVVPACCCPCLLSTVIQSRGL